MTFTVLRRKVLIPAFQLTQVCESDDAHALRRQVKEGREHPALCYFYREVVLDESDFKYNFNFFPLILDRMDAPWDLATLYLLSKLETYSTPNMTSLESWADDLGAFKEWLDRDENPDKLMMSFPKIKLRRATYRYHGFLKHQIRTLEISPRTGSRRMNTVIAFYRWLVSNKFFEPENAVWEEEKHQIFFKNEEGFSISKSVTTTDLSIKVAKQSDPFGGCIQDGGKLRPLTGPEQEWVLEAACAKGNSEAFLLQLFMLSTGARIQTACTLRVKHVVQKNPQFSMALGSDSQVFRLKAGPGTGIDTKNDKHGILLIPRPLYELLGTYAQSERATRRRLRAKGGDNPEQYLFITQQGNPYYAASSSYYEFDPNLAIHHRKAGQTIRQFITEQAIPYIRQHHEPKFHYRIHDLRASYGMNMTEFQTALVQKGIVTPHQARMNVKDLMWHSKFEMTDRYLNYRKQMEAVYGAVNSYGEQLQVWIEQAANGMGLNE